MLIASGILGFALYASSFALVQTGRLDGNGTIYTLMNLGAASFTLISLLEQFSLSAMLTSTAWIAVSTLGLIRRAKNRRVTTAARTPQPTRS